MSGKIPLLDLSPEINELWDELNGAIQGVLRNSQFIMGPNVKAFEQVVRAMHDANMGYFSINHPVDRDPVCGYTGIIENECPHCHRKEVTKGHLVVKRMK